MKRTLVLLMAVLLLFSSVLSGCGNTNSESSALPSDVSSVVSEQVSEEVSAPESKLPENIESSSVKGVYTVTGAPSDNVEMMVYTAGDGYIVVQYIIPGLDSSVTTVRVLTADGKFSSPLELGDGSCFIGIIDGGFYTVDQKTCKVTLYDLSCAVTKTYEPEAKAIESAALSNDGKYMAFCRLSDSAIVLYDFLTENEKVIYDDSRADKWIIYSNGKFHYSGSHNEIYAYIPSSGATAVVSSANYAKFRSSEYCIEQDTHRYVFDPFKSGNKLFETAISSNDEEMIEAADGHFVTFERKEGGDTLRIYGLVSQKLNTVQFKGNVMSVAAEGGLVWVTVSENGAPVYYVIDPDEADSTDITVCRITEPFDRYEGYEFPEFGGSEQLVSLAKELLEKYNIRIVYGEENLTEYMVYPGFSGVAVTDEQEIQAAEMILEAVAILPEGIINDVTANQGLWVYLATDLVSDGSNVSGAALTKIHIAMDAELLGGVFGAVFMHEFMHIMEKNAEYKYINQWIYLMPQEIRNEAYFNSYGGSDVKYTPYDDGKSEVWFTDSYARTFSAEDRARIIEKLYTSYYNEGLIPEIDYENLKTKARYISVMLRNSFETCRNADELFWEKYIGEIDMHEFDSILAQGN